MIDTRQVSFVLVDSVSPDKNQPRKMFTEKHIDELTKNIQTIGLINPIEVDSEMVIITGECRWRAAKQANWTEVPVIINNTPLTSYERLRRQLSENMLQSSADKTEIINPIDTAKGFARLLILKAYNKMKDTRPGRTSFLEEDSEALKFKDDIRLYRAISAYSNKELVEVYNDIPHQTRYGLIKEVRGETGIGSDKLEELLNLLDQPEFVIVDIQEGRPRTYYREAERAPKELKETIKKKIAQGHYRNRNEIIQDVLVAKQTPDLARVEMERQKAKESSKTNRILNSIVHLGLALEALPFTRVEIREQPIVQKQLEWLKGTIEHYLSPEEDTHEEKQSADIKNSSENSRTV